MTLLNIYMLENLSTTSAEVLLFLLFLPSSLLSYGRHR